MEYVKVIIIQLHSEIKIKNQSIYIKHLGLQLDNDWSAMQRKIYPKLVYGSIWAMYDKVYCLDLKTGKTMAWESFYKVRDEWWGPRGSSVK